jgi:hypothetical protein
LQYLSKDTAPEMTPGQRIAATMALDPPVSQAQRAAMWSAASGKSTLGIPASVGKKFAGADPGGKLPEHAKDMAGSIVLITANLLPAREMSPERNDTRERLPALYEAPRCLGVDLIERR